MSNEEKGTEKKDFLSFLEAARFSGLRTLRSPMSTVNARTWSSRRAMVTFLSFIDFISALGPSWPTKNPAVREKRRRVKRFI